ncbi:PLDc N-terminal domain-containing protein [Microbacterium murale]|uniref:RsiW-degrading membrane proteinase PrsW (M82 family) n=1 Tax=Microbacterium murale TaxID=1081040 RepID=A0ABU0PDA4_9MICO|nr:PLDc N-terminal domain-containing protein [Microbacterium murale]MDQ0644902.1 RsiW-degrading membrane proteinase PrsW (M82 family) [Microbacterium murale]
MNFGLPDFDPAALVALIPVGILVIALMIYCFVDLARRPRVQHLPKPVWVVIVLFVVPLGAVLYLVLGRGSQVALRDEDLR